MTGNFLKHYVIGIVPSVFEAILFGGSISLIGFFLDFKDKLSTVNKRELEDMVY